MITSFSHIYLPVRDVDESIAFYTENLGFKLLRKYRTSADGPPSAYLELGDVLLELTYARGPLPIDEGRVETRIGLTVTDRHLSLGLFKKETDLYDSSMDLFSQDLSAVSWAEGIFTYYRERSTKVDLGKMFPS